MFLPLSNRLEVLVDYSLGPLGLLGDGLDLSGSFELFLQGSWGSTSSSEAIPTAFGVVDLEYLLLRRRLTIGHVALLAGVRALSLSAYVSCAKRRVGGILEVREGDAAVRHRRHDLRRERYGDSCHA